MGRKASKRIVVNVIMVLLITVRCITIETKIMNHRRLKIGFKYFLLLFMCNTVER